MSDIMDLIGRLRAYRNGRAVRSATHCQVTIADHAMVIAPLAMAGEDTTIHAIAIGRVGGRPQIRVVPDPRMRDEHYGLIEWFGREIEAYFAACRAAGEHPQLWVSSSAAAGHLDILADRLRFTRDAPAIKRTGELLTYATERMPVAGQLALMTATGALAAHYSTGQQEGEDEHLGAFLTWLNPPKNVDIARAVELAERDVMGVKTNPEFDRTELQPLVSAYNRARSEKAKPAELRRRAAAIEAKLSPLVTAIYNAVQRALGYLRDLPPAGALADLTAREREEFLDFMDARDNDMPLPYRDTPKSGAFKLAARELAASNVDAGALYGDDMALARGRLDGTVLSGRLTNHTAQKVPRTKIHRFDVETAQTNLHHRAGDEIALVADPRLRCVVEGVRRAGATTTVSLRVTAGMRAVGVPAVGVIVDVAPPPPDWGRIWLSRRQMSKRLSVTPWTHSAGEQPPAQARPKVARPNDLAGAVERLR
jgi:hypothetical protein